MLHWHRLGMALALTPALAGLAAAQEGRRMNPIFTAAALFERLD